MAWTVPAIAIAVQAPSFAASLFNVKVRAACTPDRQPLLSQGRQLTIDVTAGTLAANSSFTVTSSENLTPENLNVPAGFKVSQVDSTSVNLTTTSALTPASGTLTITINNSAFPTGVNTVKYDTRRRFSISANVNDADPSDNFAERVYSLSSDGNETYPRELCPNEL